MRNPYFRELLGNETGYWELADQMGYPALPISDHPLKQLEQEMRFGKKP